MYVKRCGLDGYLIMENTSTSGVSKVGLCHAAPGDSDKRQVSWKTNVQSVLVNCHHWLKSYWLTLWNLQYKLVNFLKYPQGERRREACII